MLEILYSNGRTFFPSLKVAIIMVKPFLLSPHFSWTARILEGDYQGSVKRR